MIVYLARDIPPFVMYCVHGESGSSLLIGSTDSMILKCCILCSHSDPDCVRISDFRSKGIPQEYSIRVSININNVQCLL